MNKKSQKVITIVIGLVLSLLLVYIGFRIVQKRGSQAGAATDFKCSRSKDTEATCTWTDKICEAGRTLYASTPPEGIKGCNLVFISEEAGQPVALGDGNCSHTVTLSPLIAKQSYCVATAGNEEAIIEVPSSTEGTSATNQSGNVVLDVTPTQPISNDVALPTTSPTDENIQITPAATLPTQSVDMVAATDVEVDAFYTDTTHLGDDWGDCLGYFKNVNKQISSNQCIRGYYRHSATPTP